MPSASSAPARRGRRRRSATPITCRPAPAGLASGPSRFIIVRTPRLPLSVNGAGDAIAAAKIGRYELQGYVPEDVAGEWTVLGLAADPGVLEINLPPCMTWQEYDEWIRVVTDCAESVGLRSWKQPYGDYPGGTGGGNPILIERNVTFTANGHAIIVLTQKDGVPPSNPNFNRVSPAPSPSSSSPVGRARRA